MNRVSTAPTLFLQFRLNQYIDPKVDFASKYLFGRESTKAVLMNMLDSVLTEPPGHEIVDIELLNPFNLQEAVDDKLSILDIKARDHSGRQFNIEMQKVDTMALPMALCQPSIVRAVEELAMLTKQDIEREKYEARRKYQMDHDSALIGARRLGPLEGEEIGKEIGTLIGTIHMCQRFLRQVQTPKEQLEALSLEELSRLAAELENAAFDRG